VGSLLLRARGKRGHCCAEHVRLRDAKGLAKRGMSRRGMARGLTPSLLTCLLPHPVWRIALLASQRHSRGAAAGRAGRGPWNRDQVRTRSRFEGSEPS
jgi:hypothetical protein